MGHELLSSSDQRRPSRDPAHKSRSHANVKECRKPSLKPHKRSRPVQGDSGSRLRSPKRSSQNRDSNTASDVNKTCSKNFNPYYILGVDPNTPILKIELSAKVLALRYHSDKQIGKSEVELKEAHSRMVEINRAREILLYKWRKVAYDLDGVLDEAKFKHWVKKQEVG